MELFADCNWVRITFRLGADTALRPSVPDGDDRAHRRRFIGIDHCDEFGIADFASRWAIGRGRSFAGRDCVQSWTVTGCGWGRAGSGGAELAGSGAKHRGLPKLTTITSLVYCLDLPHAVFG